MVFTIGRALAHGRRIALLTVFGNALGLLAVAGPALGPRTAVRHAAVVGMTNPKGYLILGVLLPQFVDRSRGQASLQMLLLGLAAFVIGLGIATAVTGRTR